jgi:hypothetical protein
MKISVEIWLGGGSPPGMKLCVFFAQQSFEKRLQDLWEWRFFVAPWASFDNVSGATEGGIPVSRFPG